MPSAKNVILALLALLVLVFGVGGVVRILGARNGRPQAQVSSATPPNTAISMAKLSDAGVADNCADVTFSGHKAIAMEKLQARGFVVLKATCKETFSGMLPLASCTRSDQDDDAQPPTRGIAYYYDLATIEGDDVYRGQCLGTGGTWEMRSHDTPEYARQRARRAASAPHHEIDSLMELMQ
jgi:hypothetical protein